MINEQEIFKTLYSKYDKLFLNKDEVSKELGISQTTLNRKLKAKEALPIFEKDGGKYIFPIVGLVQYLLSMSSLKSF